MVTSRSSLIVAMVLGVSVAGYSADKKKAAAAAPDMNAMMEQAKKLGTPGANHQVLEPLAGKWTATTRMWMKPGDKPMESQGTSETSWILGNRFLKQDFRGTWNGQAFEGLGYTGYDSVRGQYETTWMDNMMTGIIKLPGSYDAASKTLRFAGEFSCPLTGDKNRQMRAEWKVVDNDQNVYTAYDKTPEGQDYKSMEIVYKRMK
jgi:hypothetical protein